MGSLSNVEAFLLSSIVDDCLRRIQIVGEVSQYTKIEDLNKSARGGGSDDEDDILPPEEEKTFLYTVKQLTSAEKFKLDRKFFQVALNNVAQELKHDISFETLKKFNEDYESNRREIKELHERLANQYLLIPKLKNDIEDIKIDSQKEMDGLDNQIGELNFQLQKLKTQFSMEKSYLKKQCTNTVEDTKRTCDLESQKVEDRVKQLGRRIEYEVKSDKEISKYNNMNEMELLKTLNYHKAKFFDDERVMKNKIRTVQVYRDYNSGKLNDLVQKLKAITQIFKEDLRDKEEEQRKLDHEQERLECAIEIQAWWRGTMVRKGLGPYVSMKKEEKEKKGKKGKNKDKKEKNKDKKEKNKDKKEKNKDKKEKKK